MILGVGVDTVEIDRVAAAMERGGWRERILSPTERAEWPDDCLDGAGGSLPAATVAGRFAAKEAAGKALGISMSLGDFSCIEVRRKRGQRPEIRLRQPLCDRVCWREGDQLHLSISHDKARAVAFVVWERREEA